MKPIGPFGAGMFLGVCIMAAVSGLFFRAYAQDATERTRAAAPYLAEDLHNVQDQWALCRGDVAILKQQLADAKAELEKLKTAPPK